MSARRPKQGDRVRLVSPVRGVLPSGALYRAQPGIEGVVVEVTGRQLLLKLGKYDARCLADVDDVERMRAKAKR